MTGRLSSAQPSGGRGVQVQHHGALPVGPGRVGVRVNGIGGAAVVELQVIEVVGVFQSPESVRLHTPSRSHCK